MKKNFLYFVFCILYFVFGIQAFAECNPKGKTDGFDEYSDGQYSFECNVENVCLGEKFGGSGWSFNTSKQLIATHDKTKYPDITQEPKTFDEIRTIYQTTQDTIFECAVLKSKYAAHSQIIKDYDPSKKSQEYLKKLNESIKRQLKANKCLSADESDKVYNEKDLHDSLSYEECVYDMYLNYYQKKVENSIGMLVGEDKKYKKAIDISHDVDKTKTMIENEYKLSHESLSNAIKGYGSFQETYVAHMMLQIIYIELSENKTVLAKIIHGTEQLISLFKGAQKQK